MGAWEIEAELEKRGVEWPPRFSLRSIEDRQEFLEEARSGIPQTKGARDAVTDALRKLGVDGVQFAHEDAQELERLLTATEAALRQAFATPPRLG